jgi:hypothetical protein
MATYLDDKKTKQQDAAPVPAVRARQGFLGIPVLAVLVGGLILAMVAWGIAGLYGEGIDDDAATAPEQITTEKPAVTPSNQGVVDNSSSENENAQTAPVDRDPTAQSGTGGPSEIKTPTGTEKTK